jgi:hypothetical protein
VESIWVPFPDDIDHYCNGPRTEMALSVAIQRIDDKMLMQAGDNSS